MPPVHFLLDLVGEARGEWESKDVPVCCLGATLITMSLSSSPAKKV